MTDSANNSRGTKRNREDANSNNENDENEDLMLEEDEGFDTDDFSSFTDTSIALRIIHSQFPKTLKKVKPFVLRSQLYSSVDDRTQVDRELEELRKEEVLRLFKLNTGQDDHAIMYMNDYLELVEAEKTHLGERHPDHVIVFDWFKHFVLPAHYQVAVSHMDLCQLLSSGGKVNDQHITLLISGGFLIRQLIDSNSYWFSIPYIGSLLKSLSQGRKELISFLNRRRYKEILMSLLEKRRLRYSQLGIKFHLRDLIGSGHLKIVQTPSGSLVQLVKN